MGRHLDFVLGDENLVGQCFAVLQGACKLAGDAAVIVGVPEGACAEDGLITINGFSY